MSNVTALEAKNRLGRLLERVARGEEIIITRYDKPVARLVPEGRRSLKIVKAAFAGLLELSRHIAVYNKGETRLTTTQVKTWIEEGQR